MPRPYLDHQVEQLIAVATGCTNDAGNTRDALANVSEACLRAIHLGKLLGERRPFLQDGMTVQIEYHEAEALHATLPQKVTCKIVETEPVVKGQTAANSFKPAVLANGLKVMVPPFVGQDELIIVDTISMEYTERA